MGYVFVAGPCFGCKRMFSYNPMRVPSITIDGERQPVCLVCINRVNPQRIANGLEPIIPKHDAYDACDEEELS